MDIIETMKVKPADPATQGKFVIINKADFNEDEHELFEEDGPDGATKKGLTVEQIKASLAEKNIIVPDGVTKKTDLQALLDASK